MKYGFQYKGCKSSIADKLIEIMPSAETFVDLFCGGCSMTHAALKSGKYDYAIANDLDGQMPVLFKDAVLGKYNAPPVWVSRETFKETYRQDAYTRICWSFASNKAAYAYNRNREEFKHALWLAVVDMETETIKKYGLDLDSLQRFDTIEERKKQLLRVLNERDGVIRVGSHYVIKCAEAYIQTSHTIDVRMCDFHKLGSIENLQPLNCITRVASLQGCVNADVIHTLGADYRSVLIPENSVIYCDIPYDGKDGYKADGKKIDFDLQAFVLWASEQKNPVFVSGYAMPEPFVCVLEQKKIMTLHDATNTTATERLYTLPKWIPMCNTLWKE